MNYSSIIPYDIANGEGIRTSLFVSGCTNNCPGCFNKEAQDFNYGKPFTDETYKTVLDLVSKPMVSGLSILGGDPLCQDREGIWTLIDLVDDVRRLGKTVWLWTGFETDQAWNKKWFWLELEEELLLRRCDVVVDGPFVEAKKDITLRWRGSSNQRVIDVKRTLDANKIVLWCD